MADENMTAKIVKWEMQSRNEILSSWLSHFTIKENRLSKPFYPCHIYPFLSCNTITLLNKAEMYNICIKRISQKIFNKSDMMRMVAVRYIMM